jgi:hypothetical protein
MSYQIPIPDPSQFDTIKIAYIYDPERTSRAEVFNRQNIIQSVLLGMPKIAIRVGNEYDLPLGFVPQPLMELDPNADPNSPKEIIHRMHSRSENNTIHGLFEFTRVCMKDDNTKQVTVFIDTRRNTIPKAFNNNSLLNTLLDKKLHWLVVCTGKEIPDLYLESASLILFENYRDYNHHLLSTRKIYNSEVIYEDEKQKDELKKTPQMKTLHFMHLDPMIKQPQEDGKLNYLYLDKMSNSRTTCKWELNII